MATEINPERKAGPGRGDSGMANAEARRVHRIVPSSSWTSLELGEFWAFRDLLLLLVIRDVNVRHRQTLIGPIWAILQPLMMMVIFTLVFRSIVGVPSGGIPYPVFALAGLLPWAYFSYALSHCGESLIVNAPMITKVYIPRLVLPVASVLGPLLDFVMAFALYLILMAWYGIYPTWRILAVVPLMLSAMLTALAVGLWLAALHVRFRDVAFGLPFLVQSWLFITPVAYPATMVPDRWRPIYNLNPMAGVVEGFRWAMLGLPMPSLASLLVSTTMALVMLVGGIAFLAKMGETMVDVI